MGHQKNKRERKNFFTGSFYFMWKKLTSFQLSSVYVF